MFYIFVFEDEKKHTNQSARTNTKPSDREKESVFMKDTNKALHIFCFPISFIRKETDKILISLLLISLIL